MKRVLFLMYAELANAFSWGYGHYLTDSEFFKWLCVVMCLILTGVIAEVYIEEGKNTARKKEQS